MSVRHTITSLFLVTVLAAPLVFLCFLQIRQAYIKHGMEERLEAGLLKTILITKQDFNKINSDEILVAGQLFDIKECSQTKTGFVVTGVFDEDETIVLQQLTTTSKEQNAADNSLLAHAFQVLHGFFFQTPEEPQKITTAATKLFQNPISPLPVCYRPVLCPPPQPLA